MAEALSFPGLAYLSACCVSYVTYYGVLRVVHSVYIGDSTWQMW